MKTAKFHGIVYEVKPTGEFIYRPAKCYGDINGGIVEHAETQAPILGMYQGADLKFRLDSDNVTVLHCGNKIGGVQVRDTETDSYAHQLTSR